MTYSAFNIAKPVVSDTRQVAVDYTRTNIAAMRDNLVATGIVQGFNYAVTGGTASQPGTLWYKRSTEVVKVVLTWGTTGGENGNVTKMAFYYAPDESHGSFPASTNGDIADALASLLPSGSIGMIPPILRFNTSITAGPLALSSISLAVASGHFCVKRIIAFNVSMKFILSRTWSNR